MRSRQPVHVGNAFARLSAVALAACLSAPSAAAHTLVWDPSPATGVAGYMLHVGYASGIYEYSIDVGPGTAHPLPPLAAGRAHYFAVTAYDNAGGHSAFSNEAALSREDADRVSLEASFIALPPAGAAPLTVRFSPTASGAILWYRWEFGDGTAGLADSTLPLPDVTHTYVHPGDYAVTFTVAGPAGQQASHGAAAIRVLNGGSDGCPCTLWASGVPGVEDDGSSGPINVGMRFSTTRDGVVAAIRFYKSPANVGAHVGELWTAEGEHLGAVAFSGETPSGWQEARFASPIPVARGATYVASYHAPNGHVARDNGAFLKNVVNGPLIARAHRSTSGNGAFSRGPPSTFPRQGDKQTNFWVDVVFLPDD